MAPWKSERVANLAFPFALAPSSSSSSPEISSTLALASAAFARAKSAFWSQVDSDCMAFMRSRLFLSVIRTSAGVDTLRALTITPKAPKRSRGPAGAAQRQG